MLPDASSRRVRSSEPPRCSVDGTPRVGQRPESARNCVRALALTAALGVGHAEPPPRTVLPTPRTVHLLPPGPVAACSSASAPGRPEVNARSRGPTPASLAPTAMLEHLHAALASEQHAHREACRSLEHEAEERIVALNAMWRQEMARAYRTDGDEKRREL